MLEHFEFSFTCGDKIFAWGLKGSKTFAYRWQFTDEGQTWWDSAIEVVDREGMTIRDWMYQEFYINGVTRKA